MSDIVISVENLYKQYRLGTVGSSTLRDDVARFIAKVKGKEDPTSKIGTSNTLSEVEGEYVWALQDINFEVKRGEVLGIIGKNGAGKSTLLKLLSKVTAPTKGQIKIKGRIASLLEVGTGFHPELTGRENIFLNGAILGMTKAEIRSKLDEIVEFSGVAKYLDTPVKRYSSGMYVRLAFAVAAHLEPEILIVDEVLAVGDAEFQKKCLGKMQDVAGQGRTVLFVSHNMGAVRSLCTNGVVLKLGNINYQGEIFKAIEHYLSVNQLVSDKSDDWKKSFNVSRDIKLLDVKSYGIDKKIRNNFQPNEEIIIKISYQLLESIAGMRLNLSFQTIMGEVAFSSTSHHITQDRQEPGNHHLICIIPKNILNIGQYIVFLSAGIPGQRVIWQSSIVLNLYIDGVAQHGSFFQEKWKGVVAPVLEWCIEK